jgi:hypothetical protein
MSKRPGDADGHGRSVRARVEQKKTIEEKLCLSCNSAVPRDDPAKLSCQGGHTLCGECSHVYVESIMGSGAIPPLCSICRGPIPMVQFERLLNEGQLQTCLNYVAMQSLGEGEKVVSCVSCNVSQKGSLG